MSSSILVQAVNIQSGFLDQSFHLAKFMDRKRKSKPGVRAFELWSLRKRNLVLDNLYDEAWQKATASDKVFLTELKALGHYPMETKSLSAAEKKLARQTRACRKRTKDRDPRLIAYFDALKKHSANTRAEEDAEKIIQEMCAFVKQQRRMPKRLPPQKETKTKNAGDEQKQQNADAEDTENCGDHEDGDDNSEDQEHKQDGDSSNDEGGEGNPVDQEPEEEGDLAFEPARLCEGVLADRWRANKKKDHFFTPDQLDRVVHAQPSCHLGFEETTWRTLKTEYWSSWEELNYCRDYKKAYDASSISKEVFELLRDVDLLRNQLDKRTLVALARRLGIRYEWKESVFKRGKHSHL